MHAAGVGVLTAVCSVFEYSVVHTDGVGVLTAV